MARRISLKDIAVVAQVSTATVSLALAGDGRVAAATRSRVQQIADQMGYHRDPMLSSLASHHFRHTGKPITVAVDLVDADWLASFRRAAEIMGMHVLPVVGDPAKLGKIAESQGASALVVMRRMDHATAAKFPLPTILWEDEDPTEHLVDVVVTHDWWLAVAGVRRHMRRCGYHRPALVCLPAEPRHWNDEVRLMAARAMDLPVIEWDFKARSMTGFIRKHRPDVLVGAYAPLWPALTSQGIHLPFAGLQVNSWNKDDGVAGWLVDQDRRCRSTLELIETRLRYGPRPPQRVILSPQWRHGPSLPVRVRKAGAGAAEGRAVT
ncbi:MAG TPA: hypothetical protein DCS97_06585 [Planctomycetes bacterium]|nr:hypothetical protein [Planctomycetota bacterium]